MKLAEAMALAEQTAAELGTAGVKEAWSGGDWWVFTSKTDSPDVPFIVVTEKGEQYLEPIPVGRWFEGVTQVDQALLTAIAETRVFFSPHQPRDKRGRWKKGIGAPEPNIPPVTTNPRISEVEAKLLSGGYASIDPGRLDDLLRDLPSHASINLEHLDVTGPGNDNLYRKHAREIPRKKMPQLPESVEGAARFQKALGSTKTEIIEVDPRELHLTQNELDSVKVGKIYGYIKDGGWQSDSLLYASREMDILDGHHRFASACAAVATGSPIKVKVMKVDMPIDDLLKVADSVSGEKVGMATGFSSEGQHFADEDRPPPPNENEPWVWVEGQWYKIITDTGDDVPTNLDYIHDAENEPKNSSAINPDEISRRVFVSRWH